MIQSFINTVKVKTRVEIYIYWQITIDFYISQFNSTRTEIG